MQKLFYLLFDDPAVSGTELREAICAIAVPAMATSGARGISVFANDEEVEKGLHTVRRCDPPIRAMVSFWLEDAAERGASEQALSAHAQGIAGYLVVESRPMAYPRPQGERAEGMKQITCIGRRKDLSFEEFSRIWFGDHCQVAIETQSSFGYVRNEIFRVLTPGAPTHWHAFVEESFPMQALTDLKVFYNDVQTDAELQANLKRMMDSCERFLDPDAMEVTYVSEYFMG